MGKNSPDSKLLRAFSAGGAVWRKEKGKDYFLLVKPDGTDRWQLPKGTVDEGESSQETAIREVGEEGGVDAKILEKLGKSQYFFVLKGQKIFKTVTYFLMEYLGDTKEGHDHEVDEAKFFPFNEAFEKLTFEDDKDILKKAKEILERPMQESLI